ncbi:PPA1309 family protein [Nigerium massiliense]|uniref:PPA1309 family protein n=1 Tax=Nigerium massiliense TaxID=1522317 RepID=UPI00058EE1A4|nr:PPA1309 family protein [Nigerium massiliense]
MLMSDDALTAAVLDIERHVGHGGWDQPARLFALVRTDELLAAEPSLAAQLSSLPDPLPDALTAVEQDDFHTGGDLADDLERIAWPPAVVGCALAVERTFVPPSVESQIPDEPGAAAEFVAHHPQRQDVRVVVGVTRTGAAHGVARLADQPDELLGGTDLVPGLTRALAQTLIDPSR